MRVKRTHIVELLRRKGAKPFGRVDSDEVFIMPDMITVRVPGTATVDIEIVTVIALDVLSMNEWEYDYWLGEINFKP